MRESDSSYYIVEVDVCVSMPSKTLLGPIPHNIEGEAEEVASKIEIDPTSNVLAATAAQTHRRLLMGEGLPWSYPV